MLRLLVACCALATFSASAQQTMPGFASGGRLQIKTGAGYFVRIAAVRTTVDDEAVRRKLRTGRYYTAETAVRIGPNQYLGLVHSRSLQQAALTAGRSPQYRESIVEEGIFYTGVLYSHQMAAGNGGRSRLHGAAGVGLFTHITGVQDDGTSLKSSSMGYSFTATYEYRFTKNVGVYTELSVPSGCTSLLGQDNNLSQLRMAGGLLFRLAGQ